ncbi:MAG: lysine--tRNA ligase [Candidatus Pacearchaeota archaeon]
MEHWAEKIAKKLIELYPEKKKFICAAGITPSGIVHIGNFRDIITSEIVVRALEEKNYKAELLLFWDDYDRFRKVPTTVPSSFAKYFGFPVSKVPDPYKCHESYARHFESELEEALPELGINAKIIYQAKEYEKNKYYKEIKIALEKRKKIAEILAKFKSQEVKKEEIENYYPLQVYCKKCGKDTTKIINYNEDTIEYCCECGNKESVNIAKENIGKLSWKVDWAMRWFHYDICFEPGGKDHATPGGSYDVSKNIAKEIFGIKPPLFQGYEFVGIRGVTSKMSSSRGIGFSPKNMLTIYEPELLRWIFTKAAPKNQINFCFDSELIRQYDEFDREIELYLQNKLPNERKKALEFAKVDPKKEFSNKNVPFRQVATFGQVAQENFEELKSILKRVGQKFDEKTLKQRLEKSKNWIENFMPELKIKVRETPNKEYYEKLSKKEKEQIDELREKIENNWNLEKLTKLVYEIPKEKGMSEDEKKKAQRNFFKNVYQMLLDSDTGPRLPTFLLALGKEKVKKLLQIN